MTTVPLSSLLTFPSQATSSASSSSLARAGHGARPGTSIANRAAHTSALPPDTHLLVTTAYPAPLSFAPLYYARQAIKAGHAVVWIACSGCGEAHVRRALRGAVSRDESGAHGSKGKKRADGQLPLAYLDALDALFSASAAKSAQDDARPALLRLKHRLEQAIGHSSRSRSDYGSRASESDQNQSQNESEEDDPDAKLASSFTSGPPPPTTTPVTVVIDDAAALAWSILSLSATQSQADKNKTADSAAAEESNIDPRIKLLRDKRRQGIDAIHHDEIGDRFGSYIEEVRQDCCRPKGAVLITHLSADNTSITPPAARTPATRGGSYGVGTGFDADDAGEEDEDEELYDDVDDLLEQSEKEIQKGDNGNSEAERPRFGGGVAAPSIDWRVDSLLRRLLSHADIWIEMRGLRSGRARDCHGELCLYGLARPCLAREMALPHLPMPADPLATLRANDRSVTPLKNLSRLSLRSGLASGMLADSGAQATPLHAWALSSWCEGRDAAMLFRIEASGDAVAWSRGPRPGSTHIAT